MWRNTNFGGILSLFLGLGTLASDLKSVVEIIQKLSNLENVYHQSIRLIMDIEMSFEKT